MGLAAQHMRPVRDSRETEAEWMPPILRRISEQVSEAAKLDKHSIHIPLPDVSAARGHRIVTVINEDRETLGIFAMFRHASAGCAIDVRWVGEGLEEQRGRAATAGGGEA